jgi:DNA polymerase-1
LELIRTVVRTLAIPVLEADGYEAVDVLATVATRGRDLGHDVVIVTGDRDALQLVEDPHVRVMYNLRGVSEHVLYDEAGVIARTGVAPARYAIYAALRGDKSDNLPGVPGVGEKTAARLVNTYGALDAIYEHLAELAPKLKRALVDHKAQALTNAQLIPLVRDVALDLDFEQAKLGGWDDEEVQRFFAFLEMPSMLHRIRDAWPMNRHPGEQRGRPHPAGATRPRTKSTPADVASFKEPRLTGSPSISNPAPSLLPEDLGNPAPLRASDAVEARTLLEALPQCAAGVYVDCEWAGKPGRSPMTGLTLMALEDRPAEQLEARELEAAGGAIPAQRPLWIDGSLLDDPIVAGGLGLVLGPEGRSVTAHRCKEVMRSLAPLGVGSLRVEMDIAVGAYLLDPSGDQPTVAELARRYCNVDISGPGSSQDGQLDLEQACEDPAVSSARRVMALPELARQIILQLDAQGLSWLYETVERPLVTVLAQMEIAGIAVDIARLRALLAKLGAEARELQDEVHHLAGSDFKINSPQQLRVVLYEELGLTPQKRTKTGYSTDAASLERLRTQHPIVEALLHYREVEKLRSTYAEGILAEVGPDGRVHATFNQTVTRTGRLSSDQPNLHNVPIRTKAGAQFREVFVPGDGCRLLVADYDQIELRIIAHLSRDPGLLDAFAAGSDVHRMVASRVFAVPASEVTPAMRSKAKMVSYGLAYGMEAFGLARRLGISQHDATQVLDAYYVSFPGVLEYMKQCVADARERGYTMTLFGRRRPIPEILSPHRAERQAAERQAMNAGIQGLAADIFKVALVNLHEDLQQQGLCSRIVLQVHDEVLVEVPEAERDEAEQSTRKAMTTAFDLAVPLAVNVAWGRTWAEAKP